MSDHPRFISDVMLGSLAKWLRILGFDTIYFRSIDDNELIKTARQQERIILTRDTLLVKKKNAATSILINSSDTFEQIKEVLKALSNVPIKNYSDHPRCAECNGEMTAVDRESVADYVPEHVFLNFTSFFKCSDCGKVYWDGSHKKLIDSRIRKILEEITTNWKNSEKD